MEADVTAGAGRRVSTLELFFDLVFVFTLTQLTVLLTHELSWANAGRVVLVFTVVFWMYDAYAYLTNQVPPDRPWRRLLLIIGMGGFLVCALAVPTVFGAGGVPFGLGYLLVVVVHTALYTLMHGRDVAWFALPNILGALAVTGAGAADGRTAEALWLLALILQIATPRVIVRATRREKTATGTATPGLGQLGLRLGGLSATHLVERHGLLLIVALGESIVAIGVGAGDLRITGQLAAGAFLALAVAAALWWTYFVRDEGAAEAVFARTPPTRRFALAIRAYYYAFLPMLLGIAFFAAGVKKSIGHLTESLPTAPALALAGGVALFLAGDVAFRRALRFGPLRYRATAVPVTLATTLLGTGLSAVAELLGLVVVLVTMLATETAPRESEHTAPA
ncbi:low temperature requirement protein A [Actinomycetota bacterium Odt1-20B]